MTLLLSVEMALRRVLDVLHGGVGAREEQRLVPAVTPTDDVRRTAVDAPHFEHFAITVRVSDAMSPDHDAITHARVHGVLLRGSDDIVGPSARWRVGPKVTVGVG
jgi:hypothetical protein